MRGVRRRTSERIPDRRIENSEVIEWLTEQNDLILPKTSGSFVNFVSFCSKPRVFDRSVSPRKIFSGPKQKKEVAAIGYFFFAHGNAGPAVERPQTTGR